MGVKEQAYFTVSLSKKSMTKATKRAKSLGLSINEYMQSLIEGDIRDLDDPWRQPLPWEVEKQYLLDAIEFYEEEKRNPQKPAHSAQELMELLDEEIQHVDERETNKT